MLDPYWYTGGETRETAENWSWSLGREQYDWLRRTLEASKSPFKFVFIHHLVGGKDAQSRGGIEVAPFFEWGGKDIDGKNTFAQKRPGATHSHEIYCLVLDHSILDCLRAFTFGNSAFQT